MLRGLGDGLVWVLRGLGDGLVWVLRGLGDGLVWVLKDLGVEGAWWVLKCCGGYVLKQKKLSGGVISFMMSTTLYGCLI